MEMFLYKERCPKYKLRWFEIQVSSFKKRKIEKVFMYTYVKYVLKKKEKKKKKQTNKHCRRTLKPKREGIPNSSLSCVLKPPISQGS
jgi:hypothetical protein